MRTSIDPTTAENNRNKANHGQSRFRGVSWRARQSIWVSAIKTNKKVTFLGCYKDEEDAARAYDVAAIEQHGNFARTNFPRADYEARIKSALVEVPAVKGEPEPVAWPANLNPRTLDLVQRFALALAKKLRLAEEKYGHTDGWSRDDWEAECRDHLYQHLEKGDPRDVAAYCAFMWHHGWITYRPEITTPPADAEMREAFVRVLASLAAAISILERTPKAKRAVASDKMFDQMLDDYRKALEAGRSALTAPGATTKSDGGGESK